MIDAVGGLASLAARQSRPERAVRLFAWAAAAREANDYRAMPVEQTNIDHDLALAKAQLDEAAFEAAWAEGQAMRMEQAMAYALEDSMVPR